MDKPMFAQGELISVMSDYWEVLSENYDTGYCEIQTLTRGTDCPDQGYFVAYADSGAAQQIADEHNNALRLKNHPIPGAD